jgi:photosystem II stability/assembly factor-like uncharacterized protein
MMPKKRRTPLKRVWKAAVPPPDDPMLRHRETKIDLRVVLEPGAARARAPRSMATARRGRSKAAVAVPSGRPVLAAQRLDALHHARGMPPREHGAPEMVRPVVGRAPGAAAPPLRIAPAAGASNWVPLGPTAIPNGQTYGGNRVLVTGRVTAILVDPFNSATLYVGTAQGGIWKSVDGGTRWTPTTDNEASLAIGALAMDPSNRLTIYAGTGEGNFSGDSYYGAGLLKTTDGGTTWTNLGASTFTGTRFSRLAATPGTPLRVFAATGLGLYRSTDGGATWTAMTSGLPPGVPATDVAIDPDSPSTVYAAFWNRGIFRCTNAGAATPTWTRLAGGLPSPGSAAPNGFTRVAIAISPSSPTTLYALFANNDTQSPPPGPPYQYAIDKLYRSTDGGNAWRAVPLPGGAGAGIGGQGFYNLNVAVDPTTPDIVFLSGISLWKGVRDPASDVWMFTDVGGAFHPDNHALTFDPSNHLVIYAGSDGGLYRSADGGASWSDGINEGLCITQFEFIDQHPSSDVVVLGGTQDNGTEQYRNSPVFYHADDGDGGFCVIDQTTCLSTYYGNSPKRSLQGGKFGSWDAVWTGIAGGGLFYPPMTADDTNPANVAFGTDRINLDPAQGTSGWPTKVALPGLSANAAVSAIHYVNSSLIYAGTTNGEVYRIVKTGNAWKAKAIHAAPFPTGAYVTDLAVVPGSPSTLVVVISGFGTPAVPLEHVWRATIASTGAVTWTSISGSGAATTLPDIPVNALAMDPLAPSTIYVATDIAVFRTTSGGVGWTLFSDGMPNVAVFDLRLHGPSRLLRGATHGRGLWERKLDVASVPAVDVYVRDHLMSSGRLLPTPEGVPAAFEDALQHVSLGNPQYHWMCADIKVDALEGATPSYQMPVASVDYLAFETMLQHRNAIRGNVNRVYVQLHNRGVAPGTNVTVKLLFADASAGLPPLPQDFWTAFPNDPADTTNWHPIGAAKMVASLSPGIPAIVEWDWTTPLAAAEHTSLLAVIDCAADPIPAGSRVLDVDALVRQDKHVGLKSLNVVDAGQGLGTWRMLDMWNARPDRPGSVRLLTPSSDAGMRVVLPPISATAARLEGLVSRKLSRADAAVLKKTYRERAASLDLTRVYTMASGARTGRVMLPSGVRSFSAAVQMVARGDRPAAFSVLREDGAEVVAGSTFVVRPSTVEPAGEPAGRPTRRSRSRRRQSRRPLRRRKTR